MRAVKNKDIPSYIIDMRNRNEPIIVDLGESVSNDLHDILGATDVTVKRCCRVSKTIIDLHYTIEEFMNDNS